MDAQQIIDMVSQRVRDTANVKTVFGDPIESDGVTIIPVASVKVAGGGGGGAGRPKGGDAGSEKDTGMGLGLKVMATPVGYIEVVDGKARMVDVVDKNKAILGVLVVAGLVALKLGMAAAWGAKRHGKMMRHMAARS
ncbi:hypothetical protein JNJ66_04260 [Candidatus Saccharibacteria bacterium]|nr:hypothetical protein [Candidatus Saccharibacteria bacterium]